MAETEEALARANFRGLSGRSLGEGSVAYFALYDWFDVDDRGAVDGFE
jgi:hypothetical protein